MHEFEAKRNAIFKGVDKDGWALYEPGLARYFKNGQPITREEYEQGINKLTRGGQSEPARKGKPKEAHHPDHDGLQRGPD